MTKYYRIENRVSWKENRGLRTSFGWQNIIGLRTGWDEREKRIENRVWMAKYYRTENRVRWKGKRGLRLRFGEGWVLKGKSGFRTGFG
jgi:hypothetical protein